MKRVFILMFSLSFLSMQAQTNWTQIGNDIDGESARDESGRSISLSADGSVVAIGAPFNNDNGTNAGHVRVYKDQGGNWVQIGNDLNGESARDESGHSVSLSATGSVVAIGAPFNNDNGDFAGHVRIYENIAGNWIQAGNDINGTAEYDRLGWSVSLSADGSVVAIGAPFSNNNGTNSGLVRVYKSLGGSWMQLGNDINGTAEYDKLGWSVSLSADGSVVAIGAPFNNNNGINSGLVRVYKNLGGSWIQVGNDINGEVARDESGRSVSLSADGSVVAIGAPGNDGNGTDAGHVRVYKVVSGSLTEAWAQVDADIDGEIADEKTGISVSLSADGNVVAIGATGNSVEVGHARIYKNMGTTGWTQMGADIDGESLGDGTGTSVGLSADGSIMAIGAPLNNDNGTDAGHVRVYQNPSIGIEEWTALATAVYPNPTKDIEICLLWPGVYTLSRLLQLTKKCLPHE